MKNKNAVFLAQFIHEQTFVSHIHVETCKEQIKHGCYIKGFGIQKYTYHLICIYFV